MRFLLMLLPHKGNGSNLSRYPLIALNIASLKTFQKKWGIAHFENKDVYY